MEQQVPVKIRIKRIAAAKAAYFNTGAATMADDEYDAEELIVKREAPDARIVDEVGVMPDGPVMEHGPFCLSIRMSRT